MNELWLFSGAGGGLLASRLLGWRSIGCVEWDDYAARVLRQCQEDGWLDRCPIFGDVAAFVGDGYARRYRGVVDVVSAGWPCQPHSVAGKRGADPDERERWPDVLAVLREVAAAMVPRGERAWNPHKQRCRWNCLLGGAQGQPHRSLRRRR